jgi:S1-C subfamily serine protease
LRPAFVPALEPVIRPAWPGQLWRAASGNDLEPGSFVFTSTGEFAGLVIDDAGYRTIVAGAVLEPAVERLPDRRSRPPGQLGVEVQPLSPAVAVLTGATGGVVVTWIDPDGAAAGALTTGDVIEEANGERLTADTWRVRTARIAQQETITLRVRRDKAIQEIALLARAAPPTSSALGVMMRVVPGVGSEVIRVLPFTAAHRAGIEAGDLIILAGDARAPTPRQVRDAYTADHQGRGVLIGVTRGLAHKLAVLQR